MVYGEQKPVGFSLWLYTIAKQIIIIVAITSSDMSVPVVARFGAHKYTTRPIA
jgi:hypothetical protein